MPKQTIPPDLQSQKLVLDSLILEYKNTFERSDKLDNKVYIVITFCGFVFVFITNLFGGLTGLVMPEGTLALLLTVLYVGSCLAVMLAYVLVLVFFLNLLRPERIHRMDPEYMQVERLAVQSEPETIGRSWPPPCPLRQVQPRPAVCGVDSRAGLPGLYLPDPAEAPALSGRNQKIQTECPRTGSSLLSVRGHFLISEVWKCD